MNCTKRDFLTRSSAQKFKRQNHKKYKDAQFSVYQCPECSIPNQVIWHLTTQPRDPQERMKQRMDRQS